jgi:hypothetical protein
MKYLLMAFLFIACKNMPGKENAQKISNEVLDTIKTPPARVEAAPLLFENAFQVGTTQQLKGSTYNFYGITIGKLKVTSGRIVACDPLHVDEYGKPFTQLFPTGEFPVQLSIAKLGHGEVVAFSRIAFNDDPVERWEFALLEGQASIPVGGEEMHGYSVDAGVGIFMDEAGIKNLDTKRIWDMEGKHEIFQEMNKHYHNDWKYTMFNFGNHNMAAFTTGLGDGRYATYIGFNAKGQPCRLLTDFGLFEWKQKDK